MNPITNKTEAYDYIFDDFHSNIEKNEILLNQAKSFFTPFELQCLNLRPEISINSCFPVTAKACGCSTQ